MRTSIKVKHIQLSTGNLHDVTDEVVEMSDNDKKANPPVDSSLP